MFLKFRRLILCFSLYGLSVFAPKLAPAATVFPDDIAESCEVSLLKKLQPLVRQSVTRTLQLAVDSFYSIIPQSRPDQVLLENCKAVAHRGANRLAIENTFEAFELCRTLKIWGIEFDIRWTKDDQPILLHDVHCGRTFGRPDIYPSRLTLAELQLAVPQLPSLENVVEAFGDRFHFMIELKEPLTAARQARLEQLLRSLEPVRDYHFLSLTPHLFEGLNFVPPQALLIVSEMNTQTLSQTTLAKKWGGITGHYLLLNDNLNARHRAQGQVIGTGFVNSRNGLYREINRGVEWVFTNSPVDVSNYLQAQ